MSSTVAHGPFRSVPSRELVDRIAEVDVATRARARRIGVARGALLAGAGASALLVRHPVGWIGLGLAAFWLGGSQVLLVIVERRRRRAFNAIARGDAVVVALHAGEPPRRGNANIELLLERETVYGIARPELARAVAEAGLRLGLPVTTTVAEHEAAAPARRRAERIGEVAAQLVAVGQAAEPVARSFQAWREGFAHQAAPGPAALTRIDAGLEALEIAARAARLGSEQQHGPGAGLVAALGDRDDPHGFLAEASTRIAELERVLAGCDAVRPSAIS